ASAGFRGPFPHPEPAARKAGPVSANAAELGFGQKWLLVAGIIITLLGLGYFLKYSFDHQWIPEWARVAMAFAVSLFTVALGGWFATGKLKSFGLFLTGGGVGMLYASTFAGYAVYSLIPQVAAFGLMIAITAGCVYLAMHFKAQALAVLGQVGGFLTPLLLGGHQNNELGLMLYLTILNVGLLTIAFFEQWTVLNVLGFIFTWLLFTIWAGINYDRSELALTLVFLNLFFLTYMLAPYLYFFTRSERAQMRGFAITLPNSFLAMAFTYGFLYQAGEPRMAGIASFAYALICAGMGTLLWRRSEANQDARALVWGQSGLFLALTVPLVFSGAWITAIWALLAALGVFGARRLNSRLLGVAAGLFGVLCLSKFFLYDFVFVWRLDVSEMAYRGGFLAEAVGRWVTFAAVLGALGCAVRATPPAPAGRRSMDLTTRAALWTLFGLVLFAILNIETAAGLAAVGSEAQRTSISVLWTLFAVVTMSLGFRLRAKALRIAAILLLGATVAKVLLFDMADVEAPFRILSFVVLGVMMIGVSYLYHRFADRLMNRLGADGASGPEGPGAAALAADDRDAAGWDATPGWDQAREERAAAPRRSGAGDAAGETAAAERPGAGGSAAGGSGAGGPAAGGSAAEPSADERPGGLSEGR
ncbi:MAG: DUF2339 domain-containing protein, partial [Planctomycetota bacterium]